MHCVSARCPTIPRELDNYLSFEHNHIVVALHIRCTQHCASAQQYHRAGFISCCIRVSVDRAGQFWCRCLCRLSHKNTKECMHSSHAQAAASRLDIFGEVSFVYSDSPFQNVSVGFMTSCDAPRARAGLCKGSMLLTRHCIFLRKAFQAPDPDCDLFVVVHAALVRSFEQQLQQPCGLKRFCLTSCYSSSECRHREACQRTCLHRCACVPASNARQHYGQPLLHCMHTGNNIEGHIILATGRSWGTYEKGFPDRASAPIGCQHAGSSWLGVSRLTQPVRRNITESPCPPAS